MFSCWPRCQSLSMAAVPVREQVVVVQPRLPRQAPERRGRARAPGGRGRRPGTRALLQKRHGPYQRLAVVVLGEDTDGLGHRLDLLGSCGAPALPVLVQVVAGALQVLQELHVGRPLLPSHVQVLVGVRQGLLVGRVLLLQCIQLLLAQLDLLPLGLGELRMGLALGRLRGLDILELGLEVLEHLLQDAKNPAGPGVVGLPACPHGALLAGLQEGRGRRGLRGRLRGARDHGLREPRRQLRHGGAVHVQGVEQNMVDALLLVCGDRQQRGPRGAGGEQLAPRGQIT
mmetsp:Transcript_70421/g.199685  ORF Transcript_70421/g.199685 Transcript_70421/m.199685 type:complete len:286 (-) Transcript_70421:656-1513(-)